MASSSSDDEFLSKNIRQKSKSNKSKKIGRSRSPADAKIRMSGLQSSEESDSEKSHASESNQYGDVSDDSRRKEPAATIHHSSSSSKTARNLHIPVDADSESSDTSIEDRFPIARLRSPEKKPTKKMKGEHPAKKVKKDKDETEPENPIISSENPRLIKLRKCLREAGLAQPHLYTRLKEECSSDAEKIAFLENVFAENGLKGADLSLEGCRRFRLKVQEAKELADLNPKNIISTEGRPRRRNVLSKYQSQSSSHDSTLRGKRRHSSSESDGTLSSSAHSDSATEERRRGCREVYARLRGLVDSDDAHSE